VLSRTSSQERAVLVSLRRLRSKGCCPSSGKSGFTLLNASFIVLLFRSKLSGLLWLVLLCVPESAPFLQTPGNSPNNN
jgi:hypothetical protein